MKKNVALIPAAGRGMRMYPLTKKKPKAMLTIDEKPILQYNLEILKELQVKEVHIVTGEHGTQIQEYFEDGSDFDLEINYITQERRKGIGHAIGLGEDYIDYPFFVILGDEMYINTNHKDMLELFENDFNALCAFKKVSDKTKIKKNYTADIQGNTVLSLIEKPQSPVSNLLGVGTYAFNPLVFDYIKRATPSPLRNEIEITDVIDTIARTKSKVYAFFLEGDYVNINKIEDLDQATYLWRSSRFDQYTTTVIIPAYNEQESIAQVVKDFSIEPVDEILVVDNNSTDRTVQIARKLNAKVVSEPAQGYGNALKRGLNHTEGDILIVTEADASFRSKDLPRILEYLKSADMVIGTRTAKELIEQGAHMDWFLQWGNKAMGNVVKILWWNKKAQFTDVGCTYRGIWKHAYNRIKDNLESEGAAFSVEMMIEMLKTDLKIVEIPVGYYQRHGGESKHSSTRLENVRTGLEMLFVILKKRIQST